VVIGRYQNPWIECRSAEIERDGVALARRQSGGGTVWHDRGNLCFTFMSATPLMDRSANIALVVRALRGLGLDARANDRLDILVDGRKVSGSAFRESSLRSFHHGTLLVSADLRALERYLAPGVAAHRAKGVKSVRSPVANLADSLSELTIGKVEEALAAEAAATWGSATIEDLDAAALAAQEETAAYRDLLASREWRFGASPPFARRLETGDAVLTLEIEGGAVREAWIDKGGALLEGASEALRGMAYDERAIAAALRSFVRRTAIGEETGATIESLAAALEEGRFS
jgi:lipoate-protein ligase A